MTGYVRKDTTNNIADGNVINAADLDAEFDGVQDAFNASTGHNHDGTSGEGAPITALGPTQDVTISSILLAPKTTNTVDIGSSALKFKDLFLAGNGSVGGTLAVTGVATFTAQPILSSLTASRAVFSDGSKGLVSNAITGTGNVVMSASPTLTGTIGGASLTLSSLTSGRVTYAGTSGLLQDDADLTFDGTTLSTAGLTASGAVTLSGGTANGVAYLNGSKVVTSGSALTFDGTNLGVGTTALSSGKFSALADLSAVNGLVIRDSAVTYANNDNYVLLQNSTGVTVGGLTHPAASSLGVWGNDDIRFLQSAAATERMRLTSTGLGIGTSSPQGKLSVSNGTIFVGSESNTSQTNNFLNGYGYRVGSTLYGNVSIRSTYDNANNSGSLDFYVASSGTTTSEAMRITKDGNVGIGTTSPQNKFVVSNGGAEGLEIVPAASGSPAVIAFNRGTASYIRLTLNGSEQVFQTSGTERMRLDSSGNLGLGVTPSVAGAGKTFEIGTAVGNLIRGAGQNDMNVESNTIYNSGFKYANNGFANRFGVGVATGQFQWFTAPSGTAGNAITFTQAMTLNANGVLLVGRTSPSISGVKVDAEGLFGSIKSGDWSWSFGASASTYAFVINDTTSGSSVERCRIDSSGNLLVGGTGSLTGSSRKTLLLNSGAGELSILEFGVAGTLTGYLYSNTSQTQLVASGARPLIFETNSSERARIDSSGNLLVGTTSGTEHRLYKSSSTYSTRIHNESSSTGGVLLVQSARTAGTGFTLFEGYSNGVLVAQILGNGNIQNTNNSYGAISDAKLKENIVDASPKLADLMQVKVRNYNLIGDTTKQLGVVAQELETVFPAMVDESPDRDAEGNDLGTTTKSVKYSVFVPMLIKAMQEQQAIIESLKARLDAANL